MTRLHSVERGFSIKAKEGFSREKAHSLMDKQFNIMMQVPLI